MDFDTAFSILVDPEHEGGYVNDPHDPGGETKYGVSKRTYPRLDIKNLTLEDAKAIYYHDYWCPAGCELIPDVVKFEHFDCAVNTSAPGSCLTAVKILQRAASLPTSAVDGILGPKSLQAINAMPPWRLLHRYTGARIRYYTGLSEGLWSRYGEGWMNRVANNALRA